MYQGTYKLKPLNAFIYNNNPNSYNNEYLQFYTKSEDYISEISKNQGANPSWSETIIIKVTDE